VSTPLAPTIDTRRYLDAVAAALADLPVEDRADLLEDLAGHLDAVAREDGDVPLTMRLGRPEQYAAELRASAGLPAAGGRRRRRTPADDLAALLARVHRTRAGREVAAFLPLLEPGWWVLRAYLVMFGVAYVSGAGLRGSVLLDVGLPVVGWVLLAGAVVGSVQLGRRSLPTPRRRVLRTAEVVLAAWAALLLLSGPVSGVQAVYVQESSPLTADGRWPLLSTAGPVTDVLPYAADGTPLEGVLLFDQDGRPLRVGAQEWWADGCLRTPRPPLAADGVPVPFSFPQRYVLDGDQFGAPCDATLERPEVPLPSFPAAAEPASPAEAPAAEAPAAEAPADSPVVEAPPTAETPAG
jgi:hypothetical protein